VTLEPFSNQERPVSHPVKNIERPFTGKMAAGLKFQPTSAIQRAGFESLQEEFKSLYGAGDGKSQVTLEFGKTIHNSSYKTVQRSAITNIETVMSSMPITKPKKAGKKKEEAPPEPASPDPADKKKKKGKKEKPSDVPDVPKMLIGPDMTPE
jgi:hypothetical protein